MSKKREIPVNSECPLTDAEKDVLLKFLDHEEWKVYQRVKKLTSGYCNAEVVCYDELEIEIFVEWGVDGQWRDDDELIVNREFLSTPEKLLS